jgi:diguanylate cyclase (GGDEF)-like protein
MEHLSLDRDLAREHTPTPELTPTLNDRALLHIVVPALLASQRKKIEALTHDAHHDPLTNLLNRRGLDATLEDMKLKKHDPEALLVIDLTNFKAINDTYGYQRGDDVLCDMAELLRSVTRKKDTLARVGGDEFIIVLGDEDHNLEDEKHGQRDIDPIDPDVKIQYAQTRIANEIKEFLEKNPDLKCIKFDLAVGGAMWYPGATYETLSKDAEHYMKVAKSTQHKVNGAYRTKITG